MVCTTTTGTDHVDLDYLRKSGIAFANAAGCNAVSVVEYIAAALFELAEELAFALDHMTLGIVGVGRIGSRVWKMAEGLGIKTVLNDPPLARKTGSPLYRPLSETLQADIITLHVPLTHQGPDATYHLFGADVLSKMKPGSILINTSRGPVVENQELIKFIRNGHIRAAVLDVWENEPQINTALLKEVTIGTPHIAGHSFDGKVRGTWYVYKHVCRHFGIEPVWKMEDHLPVPDPEMLETGGGYRSWQEELGDLIRQVYRIREDDQNLRQILKIPEEERPAFFDKLRNEYPIRREFGAYRVKVRKHDALKEKIATLGFGIAD
jgi:erythronate-4-phosphate dehydrogenase